MTGPTQKIVEGGCYQPGWYPHPGQPRRQPFRMSLWMYLALVVAVLSTLAMTGLAVANYHSPEYRQCVADTKYDAKVLRGATPADLDLYEDAIERFCEETVGP